METSTFQQELDRVFFVDFEANDPFICLYIQHKLLSDEIYETLHEKFENGKAIAIIKAGDKLSISLEWNGKIEGTVNNVEYLTDQLATFKKQVRLDQIITLFTGHLPSLAVNALPYRRPNLIRQQSNRFWLAGYKIL